MQTDPYLASRPYRHLEDWQSIVQIKIARSMMMHEFMSALWQAGYKNQTELAHYYGIHKRGVPIERAAVSRAGFGAEPNLREQLLDFLEFHPKR